MGSRPLWRRPRVEPGGVLSLLELVASEYPGLLRFTIESLEASPARLALLELVKVFEVERPAELIERTERAAVQLDRLELNAKRKWIDPAEYFGGDALPAEALSQFAEARATRWQLHGRRRPPELVRVNRLLRDAASREGAADLVRVFLADPPRK